MGELAKPTVIVPLLKERGIHLSRRMGQHLLVDNNVLRRIIEEASPGPSEDVLEIGAGAGTLTEELSERAGRVFAVEKDRRFVQLLRETLGGRPNLCLLEGDALQLDLPARLPAGPLKMVSNLPYNVATAVLLKVLRELPGLHTLVVMVQRELADRYLAPPGARDYGVPTLKLGFHCRITRVMQVPPSVFLPPPRVDSALLRMERRPSGPLPAEEAEGFFRFIDAAFSQRRKTLANSLGAFLGREGSRRLLERILVELGLPPDARPERLSLEEFARLYEKVCGGRTY